MVLTSTRAHTGDTHTHTTKKGRQISALIGLNGQNMSRGRKLVQGLEEKVIVLTPDVLNLAYSLDNVLYVTMHMLAFY